MNDRDTETITTAPGEPPERPRTRTVPARRSALRPHEIDVAEEEATLGFPLTPAERIKPGAGGVSVVLGDGNAWLLAPAPLEPALDAHRDRMFDQMTLRGQVQMSDVHEVAWMLLCANYRMTGREAAELVAESNPETLTQAVLDSVLYRETNHLTYSDWSRSALRANGLDPAAIPPGDVPHVLRHLVATGRAVPMNEFISSCEAMARRKKIMNSVQGASG